MALFPGTARRSSGIAQVGRRTAPSSAPAALLFSLQCWWTRLKLKQRRREAQRMMYVVDRLALGPKRELVLVCCLGERYLVGVGADGVETMLKVGQEQPLRAAAAADAEEARRWG